ncbi:SH3 domain-containing protein [Streptomyces beihaiensis]|uniref:SH3 domain-containing protein n=1 Tax=Streptomyces beihaiensis TaxID=2984495 RepID=A0ABT3TZW5_9ACTN|nr:SH3 domain-containing protein [Streptomyces beihaiensis]MCX3062325.1 SH3 domain-containing protein [Streptomyces beihaiensis]
MRRTTPALAAAGLLAGAVLAVTAAAPASAYSDGGGRGGGNSVIWGTVVSRTDLNIRSAPSTSASVVYRLAPGSQDRIQCATHGTSVRGDPTWYWFTGARGWASASYVNAGGQHVPKCGNPCPSRHKGQDRDRGRTSQPRSDDSAAKSMNFWFSSTYEMRFGVTAG